MPRPHHADDDAHATEAQVANELAQHAPSCPECGSPGDFVRSEAPNRHEYCCSACGAGWKASGIERFRHLLALARPACPRHPGQPIGRWVISETMDSRGPTYSLHSQAHGMIGTAPYLGTRLAARMSDEELREAVDDAVARLLREIASTED